MNFSLRQLAGGAGGVVALFAAGIAGAGLRGMDAASRESLPSEIQSASSSSAFQGVRRLVSGLVWVGVYGDWHRRNEAAVKAGMEWSVRLDPEVLLYWLDGARILAYDVPAWHRQTGISPEAAEHRRREALRESMGWLERAREVHPDRSAIPIEQAVLWWSVSRDAARAEQALAVAQRCADAPYFVGRVRAEMLVRLGREHEALDLLRRGLPRLDARDPRAMRSVVEQRIEALERIVADPD